MRFTPIDQVAFKQHFAGAKAELTAHLVIWTTTPWTLPANQAVSLHPELHYALVEVESREYLVMAEALVESAMQRYGIEDYRIVASCAGAALENSALQHPFYARSVPVVLG